MATRIRLRRIGRKKLPLFRIVVADQDSPRDGRFIEIIGTYNPKGQTAADKVQVDAEKARQWIAKGATPSDTVQSLLKQAKMDPKRLKHVEAIVLSMTPEERRTPSLMNGTRRARVARGAGRPVSEVNRLLEQFRDMQKMMKKASQGGMKGMPMSGMFGGMR